MPEDELVVYVVISLHVVYSILESCRFTSASVFQMKLGQPVFLCFLPSLFPEEKLRKSDKGYLLAGYPSNQQPAVKAVS